MSLVTSDEMKKTILQLRATARGKAKDADDAFLKRTDPRAVQGGAVCEEASAWRALARSLGDAARTAEALGDFGE